MHNSVLFLLFTGQTIPSARVSNSNRTLAAQLNIWVDLLIYIALVNLVVSVNQLKGKIYMAVLV